MNTETCAALALVAAGLPAKAVERFLGTLDLVDTDTAQTVDAKVAELKSDLPGVFGATVTPFDRRSRPAIAGHPTPFEFAEGGREALRRAGLKPRTVEGRRYEDSARGRAQARFDGAPPSGGSAA